MRENTNHGRGASIGYRFSSATFYESGKDEFDLLTHIGKVFNRHLCPGKCAHLPEWLDSVHFALIHIFTNQLYGKL